MVNSINGILTYKNSLSAGLENTGIEWAVEISGTTLSSLPSIGSQVRLYTYLQHSQDSMRLYGFLTVAERNLFLALISVNGVGPALAKKILSGCTPDQFQKAMEKEDVDTLSGIPGLGKKTAQKIILQLRGTLLDNAASPEKSATQDLVEALNAMGFDSRLASSTVAEILTDSTLDALSDEEREKEILRRAIVALSQQS